MFYNISYKTLTGPKPLCIRFDKIVCFIRVYNGTRYLVLFGPEFDTIGSRIRYLTSQKSSIAYVVSHNYARIKVDSYDS